MKSVYGAGRDGGLHNATHAEHLLQAPRSPSLTTVSTLDFVAWRVMDRIEIRGLRVRGRHGVFEDERRHGQTFCIDVTLERDLSGPAASDALGDTVDYATLAQQIADAVAYTRFHLIEALADHIADIALGDPSVEAVEVRVAKPEVQLNLDVSDVAVVVRRGRGD